MSTETLFASNNGGYLESQNAAYATARAGGTIAVATGVGAYGGAGQILSGPYYAYNGFAEWGLFAYAPGGTITVPVVALRSDGDDSVQDFQIRCYPYDFGATLTSADWRPGDSMGTLLAHLDTSAGFAAGAYRSFTDDAMAAAIAANLGGTLRVVFISDRQMSSTAPTVQESVYWQHAANPPRLVFDYAAPVRPPQILTGASEAVRRAARW